MLAMFLFFIFLSICFTLFRVLRAIRIHKLVPKYSGVFPSVTVIRPVKGLDVGAAENFKAALHTGYPGAVETIFIFDSSTDPAYEVAKQVVAEHVKHNSKSKVHILESGTPPKGRTGKLHAMIMGEAAATGELIAFSDSDTRPDKDVLRILVETLLSTKGAGSAFIPVVSDQPILKTGDLFYALLQNSLYAPFALIASGTTRSLPFIMGQYMVFTRECLNKIGGVACATGQLVDDMYIGKCVHESGLLNVIAPHSLSIFSSGLSFKSFLPIFRKWFQFGKNGLPYSFLWRQWLFSAQFFAPLVLTIVAAALGQWFAAALGIFVLGTFSWVLKYIHEAFGGAKVPLRFWWGPAALMLVAPLIVVSNRINNTVQWRGRVYKVDKRASLKHAE